MLAKPAASETRPRALMGSLLKAMRASRESGTVLQAAWNTLIWATVVVGIVFRSVRYWFEPIGLWQDEAGWAEKMLDLPLPALAIRPIAFMAISKLSVLALGFQEYWLRLPAYLAGILSLVVAVWLGRQLFTRYALRFGFVFVLALHPIAIDFSKEFKPYSVELLAHLLLLYFTLIYVNTRRPVALLAALGTLTLGFFFAYNLVFSFPAAFLMLAFAAWKVRHRRTLWGIGLAGILAAGCVIFAQFGLWQGAQGSDSYGPKYWGKKYDVFYVGPGVKTREGPQPDSMLEWTWAKSADLAAFPGLGRLDWELSSKSGHRAVDEARFLDRGFWIGLVFAGLIGLVTWRRWGTVLLLGGPWLTMVMANWVGAWPLGAFRTNLFMLPYVVALAFFGIEALGRVAPKLRAACLLFVIMPPLTLGLSWHDTKHLYPWTAHSDVPAALRTIYKGEQAKDGAVILADHYSYHPARVYLRLHDEFHQLAEKNSKHRLILKDDQRALRSELQRRKGQNVWVLVSNPKQGSEMVAEARKHGRVLLEQRWKPNQYLLLLRVTSSDG